MNRQLDSCLQELVACGKVPGTQYASVGRDGIIHSSCAGSADLRQRRPMTDNTALMAYSMSKVITAQAVSSLERAGHLRLDDSLARFLPGLPYGPGITVRHLLEHRSGIPNPIPLKWVHLAVSHAEFDESAALAEVLQRHPRLKFSPGSQTLYSNVGYWLLGRLVEQIAGQSFALFVEREVLRPFHITPEEISYQFPEDGTHAHGYLERFSLLNLLRPFITAKGIAAEREGRWIRIRDHYVNGPAFGGAIGTALGFCKLGRHLLERGDCGFGWSNHRTFLQKEGGGAGFRCMLRLDRRNKRASVVMSNATGLNVSSCLDRLDSIQ